MKVLRRIVLEEAFIGIVFLLLAWYSYYLVAVWGMLDYAGESALREYVTGPGIHVEIVILAVGMGVVLAVGNHIAEVPAIRHRPVGQIVLIKGGIYLMGLVAVVLAVHAAFLLFLYSFEEMRGLWGLLSARLLTSMAVFLLLCFFGLAFLLEVRRKVGPGNTRALITGRYHTPREEHRVFLFLDLKASTRIAENLGHSRYSQFIRHCFHDLTEFVLTFQAEIYQFVGDEVVLTWPRNRTDVVNKSLGIFFGFQERLSERRTWYEAEFGVAPEFRAGLEEGLVTVTEVGDIKREIAFHGDALNTAARLLELCREYDADILVSGKIQESITAAPGLTTALQGEIALRGKREPVSVFAVARVALQ